MKYSVSDAIVSVLYDKGTLRYGDLRTTVRGQRKRQSLYEEKYVESLNELQQKGWISRIEKGPNHTEYSLTEAARQLCSMGLIGVDAKNERWQLYRFLFFAERENIGKAVKGFSESDVFYNVVIGTMTRRERAKIGKELHDVFRYLIDEGVIRVADLDEDEFRYVISDNNLRGYVDNVWKLFFLQLIARTRQWEAGKLVSEEEQNKLEVFLGKAGAAFSVDFARKQRQHIRDSKDPAMLREHLKEQQKWQHYANATKEVLFAKRPSLLQRYPHILSIIEDILLEGLVK